MFKKDVGNDTSSNTTTGGGWIEVGKDKSDFMGFTINPTNQGVMYSSGHPQTGGNLGFRISENYGKTWQKVSDVTILTPIDFHTMTVGNNPEIIYAASGMGDNIFISTDEGKNWQEINNELISSDNDTMITGIDISSDGKIVYAFAVPNSTSETVNGHIVKSTDGGKTWVKTWTNHGSSICK